MTTIPEAMLSAANRIQSDNEFSCVELYRALRWGGWGRYEASQVVDMWCRQLARGVGDGGGGRLPLFTIADSLVQRLRVDLLRAAAHDQWVEFQRLIDEAKERSCITQD